MTPRDIGQADWPRLSPLLDELLDLTGEARDLRLAALHAQDAALADDLAALLGRRAGLSEAQFLHAPAIAPPPGLAGQVLGPYRLLHEIGQGGMGTVWLAERADGRYEAQVAVKFMHGGALGRGHAERFLREGQLLGRLDHPHIARLLDAGVQPATGQPYLVLEHVDGQAIDAHAATLPPEPAARVRLMLPVLAAVAHAHSRLILHRDLKPSNILVTSDGRPKLLDFGIGKLLADTSGAPDLTQMGSRAYTARYAAPEQLRGHEVTTATDVYALGVLLYGLLGGGHPTQPDDDGPLAQMQAVVDGVPLRVSDAVLRRGGPGAPRLARQLRGDLDTIVARALKKDPAERYANAAALAEDLRRWLDHEPVAARPDSLAYQARRFVRRHLRVVVAAASAGALALGGGAWMALAQAAQARAERAQAELLVEFMLGDLKDKLHTLGRADLLQSVGARALAYYDADQTDTLDDDGLARRARALRLIAEAARQRMDSAQARAGINQAAQTTALLLARAPDSVQRMQDHVASLQALDDMAVTSGDTTAGLALSRQISAMRHRLAKAQPGQPGPLLQAIDADQGVAYSLTRAGQAQEALPWLAQARAAADALPADLPRLLQARADNQLTTGLALVALGRYGEAAQAFQACIAVMDQAVALDDDVWLRQERGMARRSLARALLNQGRLAQAEALAAAMVDARAADQAAQPQRALLDQEASNDRLVLAELQWLRGDADSARLHLAEVQASLAQAGPVDPGNVDWHFRTRAVLLALQARIQSADAVPGSAALQQMQALLEQADQLQAQGRQLQGLPLLAILQVQLALGDALGQTGQVAAARRHWQAVAQRAQPAAQQGFPPAMLQLAAASLRLDQPQQAQALAQHLLATDFRHPDLGALQQRLAQAGHGQVDTPQLAAIGVQQVSAVGAAVVHRAMPAGGGTGVDR